MTIRKRATGPRPARVLALLALTATVARAQNPRDSAATYLARARFATDSGTIEDHATALALWVRAAELSRAAGDRRGEANALLGAVTPLRAQSLFDSATANQRRSAELFRNLGDRSQQARVLLDIYDNAGGTDPSRDWPGEALALFRQANDARGEAAALVAVGTRLVSRRQYDSGLVALQASLPRVRAAALAPEERNALLWIASVFDNPAVQFHNRDSALAYTHLALSRAREQSSASNEREALDYLATLYRQPRDPRFRNGDSAMKYLRLAADAAPRDPNKDGGAYSLWRLALAELGVDVAAARATALRALALASDARSAGRQQSILALLAQIETRQGRPDSAFARLREGLRVARAASEARPLVNALIDVGEAFSARGMTDSALAYQRELARFAREHPGDPQSTGWMAFALGGIAEAHVGARRIDSAAVAYAELMALTQLPAGRAFRQTAEIGLGRVDWLLGRPDSAWAHFTRALDASGGTDATALNWIGSIDMAAGRLDSALTHQRRALQLFRGQSNPRGEAMTLGNIANIMTNLGAPDSALAYYRAALSLEERELNLGRISTRLRQIGGAFADFDLPDSALVYLRRAVAVARSTDNAALQGMPFNVMGVVFSLLGQADSARAYFERAVALPGAGEEAGYRSVMIANLASARGAVALDDSVFALLADARRIAQSAKEFARQGAVDQLTALTMVRAGRLDSALWHAREAIRLSSQVGQQQQLGLALATIGRVFVARREPDSARVYYARAIAQLRATGFARGLRSALADVAELLRRGDGTAIRDLSSATVYFDSAAAIVEGTRRRAGSDDNAISFVEAEADVYGGWARAWLGRSGEVGATRAALAALGAVERGRAQSLLDLLSATRKTKTAAARPSVGADLTAEARALLTPLHASRTAALSYLHAGDTLFVWFVGRNGDVQLLAPRPITADSLAHLVRAARMAFGDGDSRSAALAPDDLARDATSDSATMAAAAADAMRMLAALLLPADLERRLPDGAPIVVVPHGLIGLIPFAALEMNRPPAARNARAPAALGLRHPIRYAPSFAALNAAEGTPVVLAVARTTPGNRPEFTAVRPANRAAPASEAAKRRLALPQTLVVGNPTMPFVYSGRWTTRARLQPLPGAEAEAVAVAAALGTVAVIGDAATEALVRQRMTSAAIVHLATHGLAYGTSSSARRSFLAFAPDSAFDGLLTLGELMDDATLTLHAELVVLSACQTGLGDLKRAEGTVGLQRAFLAKGARSVLVSLWNVDDAATRLLMERFYAYWLDETTPHTKADALRLAQRDVRAVRKYSHPKYWASFQLVGAE